MAWLTVALLVLLSLRIASAADPAPDPAARPKLLLAVASLRDRERHPQINFYEHDGEATGKLLPGVPAVDKRSDHHPHLSSDGQRCVYCYEVEAQAGQIGAWDFAKNAAIVLPSIHAGEQAHMSPTIDATGTAIAFEAWRRPSSAGRWDVLLYDLPSRKVIDLPQVSTTTNDERKPSLSGDGQWLAFTTNALDGVGGTDIRLWKRGGFDAPAPLGLNSKLADTEPSLSHDGRWLAFASDRPGGEGARDIYMYDTAEQKLVPLPGLNSAGQEQSPFLSADGGYLAFVSERLDSAGERDVYLYDIARQKLLPTPGLNSFRDEYDPCVIVLPSR